MRVIAVDRKYSCRSKQPVFLDRGSNKIQLTFENKYGNLCLIKYHL